MLLMQTSSSSRHPVVWMPQCSRYLLARNFAVKLTAKLGLWPGHPQLAPFFHWALVLEGRFSAHSICTVKHRSCSDPSSVPVSRQWAGFFGEGGYRSFLRYIPEQAGDWHQHIKRSVMWMFICNIKVPCSRDELDFHHKSFTSRLSSPAYRVCIHKQKMWWIGFIYVVLVWAFPLPPTGHCL